MVWLGGTGEGRHGVRLASAAGSRRQKEDRESRLSHPAVQAGAYPSGGTLTLSSVNCVFAQKRPLAAFILPFTSAFAKRSDLIVNARLLSALLDGCRDVVVFGAVAGARPDALRPSFQRARSAEGAQRSVEARRMMLPGISTRRAGPRSPSMRARACAMTAAAMPATSCAAVVTPPMSMRFQAYSSNVAR